MQLTTTVDLLFLITFVLLISSSSSPLFPNEALPTKSGYLPVNPATGSAIFYTFYEAQTPTSQFSETPLLVWLQGGPGCSSMIGNFFELSPWRVNYYQSENVEHLRLEPNSSPWNRIFGLLFLDNPIGTGFSFAASDVEIPRDQISVAKHLFKAINGFLEADPLFKNRPLYVTGGSYAGKYVPAIGYYILKKNLQLPESKRVNLQGVAIGDGLTDPVIQVNTYALNAYFSGLINERQKRDMEKVQRRAVELVKMGNWSEARDTKNEILQLLQNMTGLPTLDDYSKKAPYQTYLVTNLTNIAEVKKALGAKESIVFDICSDVVGDAFHEDVMKSVKHMVEFLVKKSKVLLYQGYFDLRDGPVSTEAWVKTLKWEGLERFLMAERKVWRVNEELAGWVQKWGSLSNVVLFGAGHLVPTDQPLNSQIMIEDWVLRKGLFDNGL
ncbi:serine carboxypeptidase-like 50 [Mangifera indica]|uniref:serine carboxypeptidase-like 50 n=1 Tax=Mangifera indica TaxID=29780 RepID=UPI001CFBBF1B|nr:serine carboxypeptidase-like 50 [Mangifera indica]